MSELPTWDRPHHEPGNEEAWLLYVVFGDFPSPLPPFDRERYLSAGPGEGFDVRSFARERHGDWMDIWTEGPIGERLAQKDPALLARARAAPACIALEVGREDPSDLDYLRDAVGIVTWLLDEGGTVALDPQTLGWYLSDRWKREIFEPEGPAPHGHVTIVVSAESGSTARHWVHTRGLRKFARPDVGVRGVPLYSVPSVIAVCNDLIARLALGGRIAEGEEIPIDPLERPLICCHGGSLDDPDYNNVHVEMAWPADPEDG